MPNIKNHTPFSVQVVPGIDKDGRSIAIVIAKGTYSLNSKGSLIIAEKQEGIVFEDEYIGNPGESEIRMPSDFVDYKPSTDVIVLPPSDLSKSKGLFGRKVTLEVGSVRKTKRIRAEWKFGALRRDRKPRCHYAGTFDQDWIQGRMPLLPLDFDYRHNQVAPPDQVSRKYLDGSEHVRLFNLFADGLIEFDLPKRVLIVAGNVRKHYFTQRAVLDTLVIWSELRRITLVWRYVIRCYQKYEDVRNVFVYLLRPRASIDLLEENE